MKILLIAIFAAAAVALPTTVKPEEQDEDFSFKSFIHGFRVGVDKVESWFHKIRVGIDTIDDVVGKRNADKNDALTEQERFEKFLHSTRVSIDALDEFIQSQSTGSVNNNNKAAADAPETEDFSFKHFLHGFRVGVDVVENWFHKFKDGLDKVDDAIDKRDSEIEFPKFEELLKEYKRTVEKVETPKNETEDFSFKHFLHGFRVGVDTVENWFHKFKEGVDTVDDFVGKRDLDKEAAKIFETFKEEQKVGAKNSTETEDFSFKAFLHGFRVGVDTVENWFHKFKQGVDTVDDVIG